ATGSGDWATRCAASSSPRTGEKPSSPTQARPTEIWLQETVKHSWKFSSGSAPALARGRGDPAAAAVGASKTNTFLGRAVSQDRPPPRPEESHRGGRQVHPAHHLAPALRP